MRILIVLLLSTTVLFGQKKPEIFDADFNVTIIRNALPKYCKNSEPVKVTQQPALLSVTSPVVSNQVLARRTRLFEMQNALVEPIWRKYRSSMLAQVSNERFEDYLIAFNKKLDE